MKFVGQIGLATIFFFCLALGAALADDPRAERLPVDLTTARVVAQVDRYLREASARKPARVEQYEALRGLLLLDATGVSVVEGHLRWICRPAYPLRPAQKSLALDSLEALLIRSLSEPAGSSPPLATVEQARSWVAGSEIGLGAPPAYRTPLTLQVDEAQLALQQRLTALRAQQRQRPTAEYQQVSRVANLDARFPADREFGGDPGAAPQFSLTYLGGQLTWGVPPRDVKGYERQLTQISRRGSPDGQDWERVMRAMHEFEQRYFAGVQNALAEIVRDALSGPREKGDPPLLSSEDARSLRITVVPLSPGGAPSGAAPPGLEVLRVAPGKGAADRTVASLVRSTAQEIPLPAEPNEDMLEGFPADEYDKIVIETGGFQGATVSALAFSPDGRWLIAAGDVVRIWDLETGALVRTLRWKLPPGGASGATSVALAPDGRRLLVSVSNLKTTLHIYDTGDLGRLHDELAAGHDGYIDKLALSSDGRWLVTAGVDQVVHVWNWPERRKVRSYRFRQPLDYLGFPMSGGPAVAVNVKGSYAEIPIGSAQPAPARRFELDRACGSIAWPDGGAPHPFALSPVLDRGMIVAGGRSRQAGKASEHYWCGAWQVDPAGRNAAKQLALHDHHYFVTASALSGDGRWAASADGLGEIHVWSTADGQVRHQFISRLQPIYAVQLVPDGQSYQIAIGRTPYAGDAWRTNHYGAITQVFNLATRTLNTVPAREPPAARLELDGWQASLRTNVDPRVLEVRRSGQLQSGLPFAGVERWWPLCYDLLPAAGRVASAAPAVLLGSEDGSLDLLDARQMLGLRHFVGHADRVWAIDAAPDSSLLLSGAGDGLASLWKLGGLTDCANLAAYVESSGRVFHVVPGTPTAQAGLKPGDRVLAIDSRPIADLAQDLVRHQWPYRTGARAQVEIDRQGKRLTLAVTLSNMGDMVRPLLNLLVDADGRNWALWTPEGYYDASPGGDRWIGWLRNRSQDAGADFVACDQLRDKLYRPDVIDLVLQTQDTQRAVATADQQRGRRPAGGHAAVVLPAPPSVKIVSPPDDLRTPDGKVVVEALVTTNHTLSVGGGGWAAVDPTPVGSAPPVAQKDAKPEVRVMVNGAPIEVRDVQPVRPPAGGDADAAEPFGPKTYRARIEVPVERGLSVISVVSDADGASSSPDDAQVTVKNRSPERPQAKLWVLAVGVSRYETEKFNLQYADRDAEAFRTLCLGQKGGIYDQVEARLLTNDAASKDRLLDELQWLVANAAAGDTVFLFLAGHGMYDARGNYYFATHNMKPTPEGLRSSCVRWSEFTQFRLDLPGPRLVMFIDTCHSGDIGGSSQILVDPIGDLSRDNVGCIVFAACSARQSSLESDQYDGHGAFTKALLDIVSPPAAGEGPTDQDSISLFDLPPVLDRRVRAITDQRQTPQIGMSRITVNAPLFRRVTVVAKPADR